MAVPTSRSVPLPGSTRQRMLRGMSGDRIVLVGIAWTVVLLVLLVLREVLRSSERPAAARVVPVVNILAGIMIVAFSAAAVLRLTLLVDPPDASAQTSATPTPSAIGAVTITPPPLRSPRPARTPRPTPTPRPMRTPRPTPVPVVTLSPAGTVTPEPAPTPTPTPTPARTPTPTATSRPPTPPTPTPRPTPTVAPTPTPTAVPTASPAPSLDPDGPVAAEGTVTLPLRFTAYTVTGRRVAGFETVRIDAPVSARAAGPRAYRLETLGDPSGRKSLVRILAGPLKGTLVSPDDPGVRFVLD